MLYQIAKSELQTPPPRISLADLSIEASALIAATFLIGWLL
jgi:hypothetical protein